MSEEMRVFVSYSHADKKWLEEFKVVLAPIIRDERIAFWDDTSIAAGAKWRGQIDAQLQTANVAILLVSARFLASDFIVREELPVLMSGPTEMLCAYSGSLSDTPWFPRRRSSTFSH